MKTLLVVSSRRLEYHAGEEYDDFIEVGHNPSIENVKEWSNRIANRIRKLWNEDKDEEKGISVYLDGASPYNAFLQDAQIFMKENENIDIKLPFLEEEE